MLIALAALAAAEGPADRAGVKAAVTSLVTPLHAITTADADGIGEVRRVLRDGPQEHPPLTWDYWPWPLPVTGSGVVECWNIRFLTPDVALADGSVRHHPALFVVKREDGLWKIASVRFLRE